MRVGVADQAVPVQGRAGPVHRRIRRQAGLHREDVPGQVGVAVTDRVEAGLRAEHGEPGRPHVSGHQEAVRVGRERDVQQVAGIEPEDRPPVRGQVADLGQRRGDPVRGVETRRVDKVVNLPGALGAAVDRGYLDREHEPDRARTGGRGVADEPSLELGTDPEQAGLGRDQGLPELGGPRRMREIPGAEHAQALAQGPRGKMLDIAVLAARAREPRMNMKVGDEHVGSDTGMPY